MTSDSSHEKSKQENLAPDSAGSAAARIPAAIARRQLGGTDLEVPVLGFGTAPLGDLYQRLDEDAALATITAAIEGGIRLFDSSPLYGSGLAEHRLGTGLRRLPRDQVIVSTKVGRVMDPWRPSSAPVSSGAAKDVAAPGFAGGLPHRAQFDYSYDGTLRSLEQSLLRLGTDHVEIALVHDIDVWTHGPEAIEGRVAEVMAGAYPALRRLRDEGVVRAIGIGVNEADMCERFVRMADLDCVLLAGRYSLLEQPALESFLPLALERKVGVMLGGVFNSGILATGAVPGARYNYKPAPQPIMERVAAIEAVCSAYGVPLAKAAMQFALGHPAVATLILGGVAPDEVRANIAAFSTPVPAALWADLKEKGLLQAQAPVPA
ncbi:MULTISPECIES: aldo/keto reductase [unclassified Chelatococcus]|uniref:aldo/keto reductase n=1 Tax=unclassified Chelatococcus TaxID=2638111 RepID=UPI001BD16679|nr:MULTISPECIES: aldo/keto reductase [unclassified Chelatococcus]MBS7697249.1 aldo/keto reductase [Chelatococcus sp. YT9]MBX3556454.1 aldo/keto reductase [Chelatococcus sp.]